MIWMSSDSVFYSGNLPHSVDVDDEMKMFVFGNGDFSIFNCYVIRFVNIKHKDNAPNRAEKSWWETGNKNSDPPQVTDKFLSHHYVSSTPHISGVRTRNGSGDIIGSKSNYHTIMTTNAP